MNNYYEDLEEFPQTTSRSISGGSFFFTISPLLFVVIGAIIILTLGKTSYTNTDQNYIENIDLIKPTIASFFMPEIHYWENHILEWSEEWGLDPNLIATVMQIESCGYAQAESYAGAMGLFQVMPFHFSDTEYPFEVQTNAKRGLGYLQKAYQTHESVRLAFAGYNGGISTASKDQSLWPDETIRYVYWGENIYQEATSGLKESPTLNEWLNAGGASLCSQANAHLGLK